MKKIQSKNMVEVFQSRKRINDFFFLPTMRAKGTKSCQMAE